MEVIGLPVFFLTLVVFFQTDTTSKRDIREPYYKRPIALLICANVSNHLFG